METNQPPSPHLTPHDLQQIANDLYSRYQQERDLTDLEEAMALYHECILLLPENDDQRGAYLFNLATMLKIRSAHQQTDQSGGNSSGGSHLDTAISIYRESIQCTPDDDPLYPTRLFGLYSSLRLRVLSQNLIEDRDEAISTVYESVLLTPEDHPEKSPRLNSLGVALHQRFEETQVPSDLDEAIVHYRASLELASTGEHRMNVLRNLALALKIRYQLKWDVDNLHESILYLSESVRLTPDGHPQRWPCANNHALLLYLKYKHDGARETLDKCIASFRMAARACSEEDRPSCYTNLATALHSRYEDLPGERGSLEESISLCEEALCLTPVGHKDRVLVVNQLYLSLSSHSSTGQDQKRIDRIISLLREAIAAPSSDPDHPSYLNNLALSLVRRYKDLKSVDDLDEAISLYETSISLTPDAHLQKPSRLSNMASALYTKYTTIDPSIEGLDQVINLYREAAQLTSDSHSEKIYCLSNTAETLITRAARLGNRTDLDEALQLWSLAVTINSAPLLPRFDIAKHWAETAALNGLHESALTAYSTAISLFLKITSVVFNADSRREQLMQRSINLPCDAAKCAIELGQYEKAIELLESGRSIFWKQLLELRHPLDDLRKDAPEIADELQKVGEELERGGLRRRRDHPSVNSELEAKADETENYYARLGERREQLITEARKIPGFERFLLPLTFKELALSAKPGHVVVLNGTKRGCDALIIRSPDLSIHRVPLPDVNVPRLRDIVQKLCKLTGTKFYGRDLADRAGRPCAPLIRDEIKFPQVLADIWNWVVNPVLRSLALKPVSNPDDLPRIWWCPTGAFAFLPLHAAGIYTGAENGGTTVAEFAVSSYTPIISTLLTHHLPVDHLKVVAVIVPKTEAGLLPLPATEKELQIISKHVPENSLSSLVGSKTSIDDVLSELATATVAHFACHGVQHFTNPLDSALLLYRDRLTVSKLMQNRIQNASLVFLDACFTAAGSQELPDEAIHLASAMLFAGFRGAIATLWSIYDFDGPTVTESVYSQLFGNSLVSKFDGASAAKALHLAVSGLRGQGKHVDFIRWVPFIHVGLYLVFRWKNGWEIEKWDHYVDPATYIEWCLLLEFHCFQTDAADFCLRNYSEI